jgi:hypothetical protein
MTAVFIPRLHELFFLEFAQFSRKFFVRSDYFTQFNKSSYNVNARIDGPPAVQYAGRHDDPVFCESIGK